MNRFSSGPELSGVMGRGEEARKQSSIRDQLGVRVRLEAELTLPPPALPPLRGECEPDVVLGIGG